jgi:hypothetical protein
VTAELRCPMRECRRRIDLDALPAFPEQPAEAPCLHFIAGWGANRGRMAEAVLFALARNREIVIRNLRPPEVPAAWIDPVRDELEAVARRFAHEVAAQADDGGEGVAALFGDVHERNHVARNFASLILGPDPMVGPS